MDNIPSVLAILICDWIIIEQGTGKKTLVGVFENLSSNRFPVNHNIGFFARLTDMDGLYRLTVRIVRLDGNEEELMGGGETEHTASDRLAIIDLALNLPHVPFARPGRYEFQLLSNDVFIGRATVNAIERS